jgi:hypothetical protein
MFSFLFKKENQLDTLILQYLENLTRTQEHFVKAMETCLDEGVCGSSPSSSTRPTSSRARPTRSARRSTCSCTAARSSPSRARTS